MSDKTKYHYYTLRYSKYDDSIEVLGWFTYPRSSVLAGQLGKRFMGSYANEAEARKAYPQAEGFTSTFFAQEVSLNHLPGENDPVPGGMYPDDWA